MTQGTVKWFSGAKGFGFITPAGGGADLFFHHSAVHAYDPAGLPDSQAVEFEVGEGRKGPEATTVRAV
ncbi:Cold shock protein CspA [Actinokineospora spheciospongiae]|uniref:Cold shock protein CspA n=1 Tax=Actinokineospora spheciospongiae TaxID=909613 RepID=W7IX62_9PSEU|nr:cold shock domain-containing protein [Actinokineospora spheciospongiae]EWC61036.1 Cold shock protein CspA [Actinokineospora spheciospongiae]PWW56923.1 CspA family cold shock protein [Actinokineospora spheciospongiae]